MNTRHLVDPELMSIIDQWKPFPEPITVDYLLTVRAEFDALSKSQCVHEHPGRKVGERYVPGPDGAPNVRVFVYQPTKSMEPLPALLWFHGGGYMIGSVDSEDTFVRAMAAELGCVIVSVDYRLAPEHPHPAPVEDCYAALSWVYNYAAELGVDHERLAVGGVSAGGGIAAALALLARDRGEVPLAFQLLDSPMLDDRTVKLASPHPYTGEFIWTREANRFGWVAFLGQQPGGEGISPYAAAARAEDFTGLPPTFISVGTLDLFLEENLEYARQLTRAGVPAELHVYPGAFHGYYMAEDALVTRVARSHQMHALRRALNLSEQFVAMPEENGDLG